MRRWVPAIQKLGCKLMALHQIQLHLPVRLLGGSLRLRHHPLHCQLINAFTSAVLLGAIVSVQQHAIMVTIDASITGGAEHSLLFLSTEAFRWRVHRSWLAHFNRNHLREILPYFCCLCLGFAHGCVTTFQYSFFQRWQFLMWTKQIYQVTLSL